jgi:iron complex outermembrane recepter protein
MMILHKTGSALPARFRVALVSAACMSVVPAFVSAQAANAPEQIVVTGTRAVAATKTDTALTETPQGISVITNQEFRDRSAVDMQDIFRYTAGVAANNSVDSRGDFVLSRGFDAAQYLDGLKRMPDFIYGARLEAFTLERAEVLRGPSSVLYGAGGAGGVLNGASKTPKFKFGGEVGLDGGTDGRIQGQVDVTGPLSDAVAYRFVGLLRDGKTQWEMPDDRMLVNPSIRFRPTPDTDVTLISLYQKDKQGSLGYVPLYKSLLAPNDAQRVAFNFYQGEPGFNGMDTEFASTSIIVSHRFSDTVALRSATRYSQMDTDYKEVYANYTDAPWDDAAETLLRREFYVNYEKSKVVNSDNNLSMEFASGLVKHQVLLGIDYTWFDQSKNEGFSYLNFYPFPSPPPIDIYNPQYGAPFAYGAFNFLDYRSTQLGLYVQDQMRIADRVSVVLGVRRDKATSKRNGVDELNQVSTSFRGGVIGTLLDGVSPYLNYAESFLPVPGGDFAGNAYEPRLARQYEAGIKWEPMRGALLTFAYFDIEESNYLSQDPGNVQNFLQGGSVGSRGFEVEAVVRVPGGFDLTAAYTAVDAKVIESSTTLRAGDRIAAQPKRLASVWGSKTFALGNDWSLRAGAGVRYIGDKIDASQTLLTPAVTLVDAMVSATKGPWVLSLTSSNLLNKQYYDTCSVLAANHGTCTAAKDRTAIVSVTRKF